MSPKGPKALCRPPWIPSPYPILSNVKQEMTADPRSFPCPSLPLGDAPGAEGNVGVHVPLSLTNLSQIEKQLGSFSSDPENYLKEFKYLTQSYDLTWRDIYITPCSTLLPEEKELVWQASQVRADEAHSQDDSQP